MSISRRRARNFIIYAILVPIMHVIAGLLDIPEKLGEHAIASWTDDKIAEAFGITGPSLDRVVALIVSWGPSAALALLCLSGWIVAFNSYTRQHQRSSPDEGDTVQGASAIQGPLRIDVGESGGFFETKRAGSLYTHVRILKLRVSNTDQSRPLTGCKVFVTDIAPHEYDGPWILKEGFSLAAGDHEFVPFASYTEPDDIKISPYGDTFMEILVTKNQPKPSSKVQHVVTIRATALGSSFCEIKCKLWVDETGRLRVEMAGGRAPTNVAPEGVNRQTAEGYEKRYAVLKSTRAFLDELASNALVSDETLRTIRRNSDEAPFLFDGDELPLYLAEISRRANIVQSITYTMQGLPVGDDKARASSAAGEHRSWLLEQDQRPNSVLTEKFRKVLRHP